MLTGIWDVQHCSVWFSDVPAWCAVGVQPSAAAVPSAPSINEPGPNSTAISASDVHMEITGYADPDGTRMPRRTSRSNAPERQRRLGRRLASPGGLGYTRIFPTALSSTRTRAARSCWTAPTMSFGRGSSTRPVRRVPGRRAASPRPLQPRPSRWPSTTPCRRRHRAGSTLRQEPHSGPPAGRC